MNGWKLLTRYLYCLAEDEPVEHGKIEKVKCAFENLSETDKTILLKRYGIEQNRQYTLQEVAAEIGTNRESVRQKEAYILRTLKKQIKRI